MYFLQSLFFFLIYLVLNYVFIPICHVQDDISAKTVSFWLHHTVYPVQNWCNFQKLTLCYKPLLFAKKRATNKNAAKYLKYSINVLMLHHLVKGDVSVQGWSAFKAPLADRTNEGGLTNHTHLFFYADVYIFGGFFQSFCGSSVRQNYANSQ